MTGESEQGWGAFLRAKRRERGLDQGELATATGLSRTHVSDLERATRHVSPEPETIDSLVAALDWPELPDVVRESARRARRENNANAYVSPIDMSPARMRPLYESGACGDPTDPEDLPPEADRIPLPPDAPAILLPDGFTVRAKGESMLGAGIKDGTYCWAVPIHRAKPTQGEPVVAYIRGAGANGGLSGIVIKAFMRGAGANGQDCLASFPSENGPAEVIYCDEFKITGVVKWLETRGRPTFPPRP
jgi:transcriptional regulator with XRE-family HTH domain